MLEFSDQELDRLAREAAENYDASQSPISWDSIRQELDKSMPAGKSKDRRKFFWLFLFAALFVGGGTYYLWSARGTKLDQNKSLGSNTNSASNSNANQNSSSSTTEDKVSASNSNSEQKTVATTEENNNKVADRTSAKDQHSLSRLDGGNNSANKNVAASPKPSNISTRNAANGNTGKSNKFASNNQNKSVKSGKGKNANNAVTAGGLAVTESAMPAYQYPDPSEKNLSFSSPLNVPDQKMNNYASPYRENAKKSSETAAAKKQTTLTKQPQKGPEISVVYSPDWSNINFTGSGEVGYNYGVLLGYNFNSRWSVETGLIYTKKNYASSGENFKFPPNYYYGSLVKAEGYCEMFDIPLNVRYNAIATNTQKVFISAGLSSYLMNKEHYKFHCTNGGNYWPSWYTNEQNTSYLFSIANLSFGYEYAFAKHFSLLAEPYFKFALSDIGSGNARLNSMGIYIGLKYKPTLGKSQGSVHK
ncbi:MAG: hypothetical protein C5B52_18115 [Bacteroidetes bacterium]|nr:MAG: hypothetical protein C5B52_18115 [Bacteroidota bacterium]